jgi:hypothetical protein
MSDTYNDLPLSMRIKIGPAEWAHMEAGEQRDWLIERLREKRTNPALPLEWASCDVPSSNQTFGYDSVPDPVIDGATEDDEMRQLREWAEYRKHNSQAARTVLRLLNERTQIAQSLALSMELTGKAIANTDRTIEKGTEAIAIANGLAAEVERLTAENERLRAQAG